MAKYLGCAETAKLVRQALKESFPGTKFSVRSDTYSGGASIDIRYTDGPARALVEAIADQFKGAYFDGMIDYKGSRYHKLDGEEVRMGADFISVGREYSDAYKARAERFIASKYGSFSDPATQERETRRVLAKLSCVVMAAPSATLARLQFTGDDGYGAGTVGTEDNRDTARGYPRIQPRVNAPSSEALQ